MSKNIVVAGGAGFIGKNLVLKLLEEGWYVVVVDNLSTSTFEDFISFVKPSPSSNLIFSDFDITKGLPKVLDGFYADVVVNLACPPSPVYYEKHPLETFNACVEGTRNLLEYSRKVGAKFIQASTSEVYGKASNFTQSEDYIGKVSTTGPRACYSEGKRAAETLCKLYAESVKSIWAVRIFNTYGPGMAENDGRLIPELVVKFLKREYPNLYGNFSRCYMYIDDLVEGLIKIIDNSSTGFNVVNLGNPSEYYTTKGVAILTYKILHPEIENITIENVTKDCGERQDDPPFRCPNIQKAIVSLDFFPTVDLEQGLEKTIDYFKVKLGLE